MKILSSKTAAWLAFVLILTVIVFTFKLRTVWWAYFDIFFAFMMVFCHVIALVIAKNNRFASSKLEKIAFVMGVLTVISLAGEAVVFSVL